MESLLAAEILRYAAFAFNGLLLALTGRRHRPFYNAFCGFIGFQEVARVVLLCHDEYQVAWKNITASAVGLAGAIISSFFPVVAHYSLAISAGSFLAGYIVYNPCGTYTQTFSSKWVQLVLEFCVRALLIAMSIAYAFFKENGAAWIFSAAVGSSLTLFLFRYAYGFLGLRFFEIVRLICFLVLFCISLWAQLRLCPELREKEIRNEII